MLWIYTIYAKYSTSLYLHTNSDAGGVCFVEAQINFSKAYIVHLLEDGTKLIAANN